MYYRDYTVKKFAKGGETTKKGSKFGINDMVMVDDSGFIKSFIGFDTTKPAKIIDVHKVKTSRGTFYTYGLEFEGGKKPFNYAMENKLSLVHEGMMAKGGNLAGISEKDFANNRVIKKGNIEIELSKDYPTHYYAHFIDMSKEGRELILVYAHKNWNKVVKEIESFKYAKGGNYNSGRMDEGGSIMDYNDDVYDKDYDNKEDELMGFNVMINTTKDFNKFKKFYVEDADDMGNNILFFSFDDEKKADKKIVILENHFKRLNINDYFIQKVYSSEFN